MLTARQKQIRDFVTNVIEKKEAAPSECKLARHFRISASTAREHLEMLLEKVYLEKAPRASIKSSQFSQWR